MKIKGFEVDTHGKKQISAAYYVNQTFEVYFEGFTLIKENCSIKQGKKICKQIGIEWEWGDEVAVFF
jgi:hypothetical protein